MRAPNTSRVVALAIQGFFSMILAYRPFIASTETPASAAALVKESDTFMPGFRAMSMLYVRRTQLKP